MFNLFSAPALLPEAAPLVKTGFCGVCLPPGTPERLPEENDLRDDEMQPGQMAYAVCRGCGWGLFDRFGQRVALPRTCLNCAAQEVELRQGEPVCAACGGMMIPTLASSGS